MRVDGPVSLADLVTDRLRLEIVLGHFELGDALSESRIARRYEVSRTPVREAFARLEMEGIVRTEPQSGTYVFTMGRAEFVQVSETRSVLEVGALRLAMRDNGVGLAEAWRTATDNMEVALREGDSRTYSENDAVFHEALFQFAANPYLTMARRSFASKIDTIRNKLGATPEHMQKSFAEHKTLTEAIEAGDVETAATVLDTHIRHKGASFWTVPEVAPETRWDKMQKLANLTPQRR
ncbi:FCD domain-containing protein [Alphaproteobacteria bacterium HT1-32]|nr:FCD domain-containing protein [Alphaproteobacteria bacterium HT1-32]